MMSILEDLSENDDGHPDCGTAGGQYLLRENCFLFENCTQRPLSFFSLVVTDLIDHTHVSLCSLYKHFGTLSYGIATYTKLMLRNSSRANRTEAFKSITTRTRTFKSEETHEPKYYLYIDVHVYRYKNML